MMVCDGCGDARDPDLLKSKPGEIHYQPCQRCGEIGIRNTEDRYQEIHRKKSNKQPYESSSYRGGKLVAKT